MVRDGRGTGGRGIGEEGEGGKSREEILEEGKGGREGRR